MKFELTSLPRTVSDEELIAEIKRVDALIGKDKIVIKDFNKLSKITAHSIGKRFGGWENALKAAGLGDKYSGIRISDKMRRSNKNLSDDAILNELKRIAKKLDQNFVTQENVNSHSEIISGSTIGYRFGSWEEGIRRAGLQDSPGYNRKLSKEELFENLLNVWTHYGRQPKYGEMNKSPSTVSPKTYEVRFGKWRNALEAFVEKMNEENDQSRDTSKFAEPTEIIREVKARGISVEDRRGVSVSLRYKVLSRDKFKCFRCGSAPAIDPSCKLHVDHIVPFSRGGKTTLENLQTLCEKCNLGKGNRHVE